MSYFSIQMPTKDPRTRASGLAWVANGEDFLGRLRELLGRRTAGDVAKELSEAMGQRIEESTLRQLKRGKALSSVIVGPLCVLHGWPVPPLADVAGPFSINAAKLYELEAVDPEYAARLADAADARLRSWHAARDLLVSDDE
jgi:hypothetical protein